MLIEINIAREHLKLHTTLKKRPGFESYINTDSFKLPQAIIKLRISTHKFPIETALQ